MPYNGKDNDDYVNGQGCLKDIVGYTRESLNKLTFLSFARQFCCNDGTPEAAQVRAMARTRAASGNFKPNDDYEKMQFYYHPDHLGSSSYITNLDGEVSQHIEYVPFGEVFIEERNNTWNTPYLFNAKEFDEETGMYYYGARYYEPRLSLWMSVDRFAENYPNIASYCFSANNPLHIVDENGDSIQIREFGQETKMWNVYNYDVESGSFKDANGTKYSGTNENIARTTSALNVLRSKKAGNDLVTKLSQSSKKVIILAQEGTSNGEGEGSQGYDSYVKWDPTKDAAFGGGSFVALGHELAHSLDRLSGTMYWSNISNILPDGSKNVVEEVMTGTAKQEKAYGDISYLDNRDQHYMKEQVKFDWDRTHANSRIVAGDNPIDQLGMVDSYRLLNKFHLTNRSSEYKGYEFLSLINLEKRPHSLAVSPNLFSEVIPIGVLDQQVDIHHFSTENNFCLLSAWRIGEVNIHPSATIDYQHNTLSSSLANFRNDLKFNFINAGFGARATYNREKLYVSFNMPIRYKYFQLEDIVKGQTTKKSGLRVEPNISLTYNINSNHQLNLNSNISYSTPIIENLYTNNILTSYRQLSAYDVTGLFEGLSQSSSLGYSFKNILTMTFAGIDLL